MIVVQTRNRAKRNTTKRREKKIQAVNVECMCEKKRVIYYRRADNKQTTSTM